MEGNKAGCLELEQELGLLREGMNMLAAFLGPLPVKVMWLHVRVEILAVLETEDRYGVGALSEGKGHAD